MARIRSISRGVLCSAMSCPCPTALTRPHHLRREGSRDFLPADRAAAPAEGRPERARDPARRRGLRRLQRLRRALLNADRGTTRRERPKVQPLPYDRALLADATGVAH